MENTKNSLAEAKRTLKIADHIVFVTYKLVNDPKILIVVLENLFLCFTNSMAAVLYYERYYKKIPPFHDNFQSKFNMFREKIINKYNISSDYLKVIEEIKDLLLAHQKSPLEFKRKDKFVICSEQYKLRSITIPKMKDYVAKAKEFLIIIERIISRQEKTNRRFY